MALTIKEVIRARQLAIEVCNVLPLEAIGDAYAEFRKNPEEYSQYVASAIAAIWCDFIDIPNFRDDLGL